MNMFINSCVSSVVWCTVKPRVHVEDELLSLFTYSLATNTEALKCMQATCYRRFECNVVQTHLVCWLTD